MASFASACLLCNHSLLRYNKTVVSWFIRGIADLFFGLTTAIYFGFASENICCLVENGFAFSRITHSITVMLYYISWQWSSVALKIHIRNCGLYKTC